MKNLKVVLVLVVFLNVSLIGYCESSLSSQSKFSSQINLKGAKTVSHEANKSPCSSISSPFSDIVNDPVINSVINSYGNMIQTSSGGAFNPVEQTKQQLEYSKQTLEYEKKE